MLIQTTGVQTLFLQWNPFFSENIVTVPLHENKILVRSGHSGRVHSHSCHDDPRIISFAKLETQFENYRSKICYVSNGCFKMIND